MNTQDKIFAFLSKVQKVKEVKKENLGAIEDAINDVKNKIEASETEMYDLLNNLNNEIDNSISVINIEVEAVKDYSFDYDNEYGNAKIRYKEYLDELKSAGIDYDESYAEKIMTDYENAINRLGNIFAIRL